MFCTFTSVGLWDDVGDVPVGHKGVMEDVGGLVLACQRVKNLTVNSDLDVLPFGVTHLKEQTQGSSPDPFREKHFDLDSFTGATLRPA